MTYQSLFAFIPFLLAACGGGGSASIPQSVVIDGDSLAIEWPDYWPVRLKADRPDLNITNTALEGAQGADRLANYKSTKANPGDVYILVIGTNDVRRDTVETGFASTKQVWQKARADGYRVIATTVSIHTNDIDLQRQKQYNALVRANSALYDVLLDLEQLFPHPEDLSILRDGVHFAPAGHQIFLDAVKSILR